MKQRITQHDIDKYKRDILEQSVLVCAREAASILACSERSVHRLVQEGALAAYGKNSGSKGRRFLASELRDYVRSLKIDLDELRV